MTGYVHILMSAFFFCLMTVFVKLAGQDISTIQIVFVRGVFTLVVTYAFIVYNKVDPLGRNRNLLMARGVTGTVALFLVYESIQRFPLPEATVIQYLYPIFTALLASIILSEKLTKMIFAAIILGLLGVYITLDFPFLIKTTVQYQDTIIALSGAFLTGLAYVMVRKANNLKESPYVIMFYFPLFTVPLSLVLMGNNWVDPNTEIWMYLFLVGLTSQLGQMFLTFGYRLLPASRASITSYVQVPFSVIAGIFIFNHSISINFILGSVIIFFAIIIVFEKRNKLVLEI